MTRGYGDEIPFVSSGGIFEYTESKVAKKNLHLQLHPLIRKPNPQAPQGFDAGLPAVRAAKEIVKRAIGRNPERDL